MQARGLSFFIGLVFGLQLLQASDREVRFITPPLLDDAHLGKKIVCHRPMRHGAPRFEVEKKGAKVIAHNYGHGGSGWTLAPGSVAYVNALWEISEHTRSFTYDTPITVVGAGVVGLFTAYDLLNQGFTNITLVAENIDNLTSHNAGGLIAPVSMNNHPEMQDLIDTIAIDAYIFYEAIALGLHPDFKAGAVIVPAYFDSREDSGLEPYVNVVMNPAKDVEVDFGTGTKREMVVYDDAIFVDTATMMESLTALVLPRVKLVQKKITSFDEIEDPVIINCAGLGATELCQDKDLVPVQGHLIMLKNQKVEDLQHMILVYLDESLTKAGQSVKHSYYIFPKHLPDTADNDFGVIGGTFIEGAGSDTPNEEQFELMVQRAKDFYGLA